MLDIDDLLVYFEFVMGGEVFYFEVLENWVYYWGIGDEVVVVVVIVLVVYVVIVEVLDNCIIVNLMELCGCYVEVEDGCLYLCLNGQGVWGLKKDVVWYLGLLLDQVCVIMLDVGGGFGMKVMVYCEYLLVVYVVNVLK